MTAHYGRPVSAVMPNFAASQGGDDSNPLCYVGLPHDQEVPTTHPPERREKYQHDESFTRQVMSQRTAASTARFFTPYLKPGMRVLDCGCGQGSVTIDLAEIISPGEAVGIDVRESDLEDARARAAERGVTNVSF